MKTREEVLEEIDGIRDLPSLPRVVIRLQREMNNPGASIETVARIINEDPPIAMKVLRVVNSPLYRGVRQIVSIHDATLRLGLKEIYEIAIAASICDVMHPGEGLDFTRFWNHSISVAHATKAVMEISTRRREAFHGPVVDAAFTAGLLHDIGVLILNRYRPGVYSRLVEENDAGGPTPINAFEQANFGVTHGEAGGFLLRKWHLPEEICHGVEGHHSAGLRGQDDRVAQVVHVADYACVEEGISGGVEGWTNGSVDSAWTELGLTKDDIPEIIDCVRERLRESPLLVA